MSHIAATNGCSTNNGGCSHLCVAIPGGKTCLCPDGWKLNTDLTTCTQGELAFISLLFAYSKLVANVCILYLCIQQ